VAPTRGEAGVAEPLWTAPPRRPAGPAGGGGSGAGCCRPGGGTAAYRVGTACSFPNTCQPMIAARIPMMRVRNGMKTT
jgi:hypothetical protein